MAGKMTTACTEEQYTEIITTIFNGIDGFTLPNPRIATALEVEANTGLRIGDVLSLRMCDILKDGSRYRFNMIEQKTKKRRTFTLPTPVYTFLRDYTDKYGIGDNDIIFNLTVREVQKHLKRTCDLLGDGYETIGTHSFRKAFATRAYKHSDHDIELVRRLLQHSSASITSRYIGMSDERIEDVLKGCVDIVSI